MGDEERKSLPGGPEGRALFRALLGGQWTLVGPYERDGEHYYLARPNRPEDVAEHALTADEAAVVKRVLTGAAYGPIAEALGVNESTIATRLKRALAKLGIESRAQLIVLARRLGVVRRRRHTGGDRPSLTMVPAHSEAEAEH